MANYTRYFKYHDPLDSVIQIDAQPRVAFDELAVVDEAGSTVTAEQIGKIVRNRSHIATIDPEWVDLQNLTGTGIERILDLAE